MGTTPIHGAAVPYPRNAIAFHQLHISIKQKKPDTRHPFDRKNNDAIQNPVLESHRIAGRLHRVCRNGARRDKHRHPPQLSSADARTYTIAKYLASFGTIGSLTTDNWDPTGGVGAVSGFRANYAVAADGTAQYKTVQAAIDAAVNAGGVARRYISVKAGIYNELVCVPESAPPITLYGLDANAGNTQIVYNNANPTPASGAKTNPCMGTSSNATVGTLRSATAMVRASDFHARNLTFKNSYVEGTYADNNQSAVALAVRGDKAILENVSVIGNQDTLFVGATSTTTVIRAYFKNSFIQGDTDFIFGAGTAVFHGCTIQYTAARLGAKAASYIFAPSTARAIRTGSSPSTAPSTPPAIRRTTACTWGARGIRA